MTPLQFEARHVAQWQALESALDALETGRKPAEGTPPTTRAADLTALYRQSCEHLALARSRAYPVHLVQRLEALTQRAHQAIYRRHDFGLARLQHLLLVAFPQAVRAHARYVLVATLVFVLPTLLAGWGAWRDPGFILTVLDAQQVSQFDDMYNAANPAVGRPRDAGTDWQMFGFYIMNNIGVAFRCFAGGLLFGIGSLFFLGYNGLLGGAVGGYLTARGHGEMFYSFVVTHAAFELTAIVLAGAAGLRLGHALVAPGRHTRLQALRVASHDAVMLVYGVVAMLVVAAGVEAFWSSARWVAPPVKYAVGAACWALVLAYLAWQGRPRKGSTDAG